MQISCHTPFCSIVAAIWGTILREFDANEENVVGSRALGAYKHLHNQRSHTVPQGTLPSKVKMWRNHNKACYKLYIETLAEVKCKKIQNNAMLKSPHSIIFKSLSDHLVWPFFSCITNATIVGGAKKEQCVAILALISAKLWEERFVRHFKESLTSIRRNTKLSSAQTTTGNLVNIFPLNKCCIYFGMYLFCSVSNV